MKKSTLVFATCLLPSLALAGARVSAEKKVTRHRGSVSWGGSVAIDGNPETAWMVPGESQIGASGLDFRCQRAHLLGFPFGVAGPRARILSRIMLVPKPSRWMLSAAMETIK